MGILSGIKRGVVMSLETLLKKSSGLDFPDKEATLSHLAPYLISSGNESQISLPEVRNIADKTQVIFPQMVIQASRDYIWKFESGDTVGSTMRIGSVIAGNKVFQTDFGYVNLLTEDYGTREVIGDFISTDKREVLQTHTLIAPWSHYFRKEYYMFVMFIAAKLCRIKEQIPADVFSSCIVSYPLFETTFEKEYLELLGVQKNNVVDSRTTKTVFRECYLGNNDNWLHPNIADVLLLKQQLEPKLKAMNGTAGQEKRVYICRSGRRQVTNEPELIEMLAKYDFTIYEDKPRSVAEQFAIYHNADFILGPHGSSFANVVWCKPGAHLLELFPPRYVYNFFYYLAVILDLKYAAYSSGPVSHEFNSKAINDDITVSIPDIESYLQKQFASEI